MTSPLESKFWEEEERLLWLAILPMFIDIYADGAEGALALLPAGVDQLVNYDLVNQAALDYARLYRYGQIKGITDTTRKQVQEAIAEWIRSGDPLSTLEAKLSPIFGKVRAQMIASTETTRIFASANKNTFESTGFVSEFRWMTTQDDRVCPICAPRDQQVYNMNEEHPPAHPRCRCWIQPVVNIAQAVRRIVSGL